ncbi:MAG: AMIN domain-containing protein [Candidatus Rokuibacteriota bacterium]|nr:MAG: AMIN domain-containing protein [Candidatus Rokubacteria bacterium]
MTDRRRMAVLRRAFGIALLLLFPAGAVSVALAAPEVRLQDVTVTTQPDSVTIVVKTSGEAKYQAELMDRPYRLVVDFENTTYGWRKTPLKIGTEPLTQVRGSQYKPDVARVVIELTRKVGYAIREESDGLAIVIPTTSTVAAAEPAPKPATAGTPASKPARAATPKAPAPGMAAEPKPAPADAKPAGPSAAATEAKSTGPAVVAQAPTTPVTPAPVTPAPAVQTPLATNGQRLISLDFKDADVVNLLRILAAESGRNIVIGEDVKGKMSITLRNVPWEVALDTVMESKGLVKVEREGVMRIVTSDQLAKEREARAKLEEAKVKSETEIRTKLAEAKLKEQEAAARQFAAEQAAADLVARGPLKEETIRLSYADPEEIANTLVGILGLPPGQSSAPAAPASGPGVIPAPPFSQLFGPGQPPGPPPPSPSSDVLAKGITIKAHKPTNSLFIRHYAADLERIKTLIREKLDIPLPQVKIEARMEILARNDLFALGIQWGGGGVANNNQAVLVGRGFTSSDHRRGDRPDPAGQRHDRPAERRQPREPADRLDPPRRRIGWHRRDRVRHRRQPPEPQPRAGSAEERGQDPHAGPAGDRDRREQQGHRLARRGNPVRDGELGRHPDPVQGGGAQARGHADRRPRGGRQSHQDERAGREQLAGRHRRPRRQRRPAARHQQAQGGDPGAHQGRRAAGDRRRDEQRERGGGPPRPAVRRHPDPRLAVQAARRPQQLHRTGRVHHPVDPPAGRHHRLGPGNDTAPAMNRRSRRLAANGRRGEAP